MYETGWIKKPEEKLPDSTAIVFVHGILSKGETCWKNPNGTYWPEILKDTHELNPCAIYVYNYQTSFGSGSYSLSDAVDDLKEHFFSLDDICDYKNIIFACHSMGGIIARKLVVERSNDFIERKINIGFFLIASPSLGSEYANWLEPIAKIAGHRQATALRFSDSNQWLNDLDKTFLNLKESNKLKISGKELVEDKFFVLKWLLKKPVVPKKSAAKYFGDSYKVPESDHSSIAKPENSEAIQNRILIKFIQQFLDGGGASPTTPSKEPLKCLSERLGTYLSREDSSYIDEHHHYVVLDRKDLLNYQHGNFHSVRYIHIKNISSTPTTSLVYVECSEKKCNFLDTNVRAYCETSGQDLKVESMEDKSKPLFSHAIKFHFPSPLNPGEEFKLFFVITLPNELQELSEDNEIMSIYLGRIIHSIDLLRFSVCLNFNPKSISTECEDVDENGNSYHVTYDGNQINKISLSSLCANHNFRESFGIDWQNQIPTCLSIEVSNPKHKLYKIRYMR